MDNQPEEIEGPLPNLGSKTKYLWRVQLIFDPPLSAIKKAVVATGPIEAVEKVMEGRDGNIIYMFVTQLAPDSYELIKELKNDTDTTKRKKSSYAYDGISKSSKIISRN